MSLAPRLRALVRQLLRRSEVERDLDDELRSYVELLAAEKVRAGVSAAEAHRAALLEMRGIEQVKESVRDARGAAMIDTTIQDIRYALRTLGRSPGFVVAAVAALALGIGATTAIVSVVDGVLLRGLPYREPGRLVAIMHERTSPVSPANYLDWKRESSSFSAMGAAQYWTATVAGSGDPERIQALRTTPEALALTGVQPALGRVLGGEAGSAASGGDGREAVLSWGLFVRRFGADSGVLGRTIVLDGEPHVIVGVMPRHFDFPIFWAPGVEVWAPLPLEGIGTARNRQTLRVFGRLRPEATLASARAEMATITQRLEAEHPGSNRNVTVTPLSELVVGDVRPALLVLLAAVGFLLLITCANVAHMMLARATARRREIAIRAALGATRRRLVRQLLVESLLLAGGGGVFGVLLALLGIDALAALGGANIPRVESIAIDGRVLGFAALISLATALVFGLAPALRAARADMANPLRGGTRTTGNGAGRARGRALLVSSEVALALVLLVGAGLSIRSFAVLRAIEPGLDADGVLTMQVALIGSVHEAPGRRAAFYESLLARVRSAPGVAAAGAINHLPIAGDEWGVPVHVEGRPPARPGEGIRATMRVVFPGYLETLGIPLVHGRGIAEGDRRGGTSVVVVNETFAQRHWPGEDPTGRRITIDDPADDPAWLTVVGVTRDVVRSSWTEAPGEEIYVPYLQSPLYLDTEGAHVGYMTVVARAECAAGRSCDAAALAPATRGAVRSLAGDVPLSEVRTMESVVAGATAQPRFTLVLLGTFAVVALVLATLGIYGVISYSVTRRTREIGIRLALGARPLTVVRLIAGQGLALALGGMVAGAIVALALARGMERILYGVQPADPLTFVLVILVLGVAAFAASAIPAGRAARMDPVKAIRAE